MSLNNEQVRLLLHFQWLQGVPVSDAARAIRKAYGTKTNKSTASRWYANFEKDGRQLKDKPRSGQPIKVDQEGILRAVRKNPTLTTRMLAEDFDCNQRTVVNIFRKAGLKWRKVRWVPHLLTDAQRQQRIEIAAQLLGRQEQDPFLQDVVTMDETWIPFNNPNPHNAWLLPKQRAPPTPVPDFRQRKIMLSVYWDSSGIIYWELLDRTVNSEVICAQLDRVEEVLQSSGRDEPVILLWDHARPHDSKVTKQKLRDLGWEILPHAPYSPDKAPSDFHLFRSLKGWLKGKRYQTIDEVREGIQEFFDSKGPDFYARGINNLVDRWEEIIEFNGDYCT